MENVEWRPVKGYEGVYEISNGGELRSVERKIPHNNIPRKWIVLKSKIIKTALNRKGYPMAILCHKGTRKTCTIHRLVANAFVSNPDNLPMVNHKDGNKANNRASNLEWCTGNENMQHAYDTGLKTGMKGEHHPNAILTDDQILNIRKRYDSGETCKDIQKDYPVTIHNIRAIAYNQSRIN